MAATNYDAMLEAWAEQLETVQSNLEALYGAVAITPVLPGLTNYDGMFEAIADETEKAYKNFERVYGALYDREAYSVTVSHLFDLFRLKKLGGKSVVSGGSLTSAEVTQVISKGRNLAIVTGTLADGNIAIANFGENTDFDALTISFQCNAVTFTNASASAFNLYTDVNNHKMPTSIKKEDGTYFTVNMTPYTGRAYLTVTNTTVKGIKFYTYSGSYAKWSGTFSDVQVEAYSSMTEYSLPSTTTTDIPAEVQALAGYGWSCPNTYNYIDFESKEFVQNVGSRAYASGDEDDATVITDTTTTHYPLAIPVITDISDYLTGIDITVEAGGTLTFVNTDSVSVFNEVEFVSV